jgi:cytochrome P450
MTGLWPRKLNPQELDGDEHRKYRKLLLPFFGPTVIKKLVDGVQERAVTLVDQFADVEEFDFVEKFAKHLPTEVFIELFGLPIEQRDTFVDWAWDLLHASDENRQREVGGQIVNSLLAQIAARQSQPADDLISELIRMGVDGRPLTGEELLDMCFLLFIAGLDTVTSQLSVLFWHLATHPEQQDELRHDPELIPRAVEELLRAYPIVPPARTLTCDHALAGVAMRAGDTVMLCSSAASRDPSRVPDAQEVRFDRRAGFTTAFGIGPHRCLGSHLARQELQVSVRTMLSRAPRFELAPGAQLSMRTAGNVWGYEQLPLRFVRPDELTSSVSGAVDA